MSEETSEALNALLHIADDHPCCKSSLIWAHKRFLELERENAALREELKIMEHRVIVCGVAATHPDHNLTLGYPKEWDSQQAEQVRSLRAENAALRQDKARLEESLASFYPVVAPVVEHFPVGLWEHMGQGRCRGTWAEDGSPYYFTVPHQLVPAFFALQRLAKLAEEKHAERKEAQP